MAVTISRLYDRYADAERAVTALETAGIPHSDVSIVANNSDNWYTGGKKDRDRDGVNDRAESAGKGAGIGAGLGAQLDYSQAWDFSLFQGWARWWRPDASSLCSGRRSWRRYRWHHRGSYRGRRVRRRCTHKCRGRSSRRYSCDGTRAGVRPHYVRVHSRSIQRRHSQPVEPIQGRIHIEKINEPFLFLSGGWTWTTP
jgi:hypothetical protein